jgi:hypothetical protein
MQSSTSKLYFSFFSHDVLFGLELMAIVVQEEASGRVQGVNSGLKRNFNGNERCISMI